MIRRILEKKPLVEAIFELRWECADPGPTMPVDPYYKLRIGRVYDQVRDEYPFHEQLPTAVMPDEMAEYIIQHRFRKDEDKWPLIQIGPGIVTLNDTEGYVWEDFEKRISRLVESFFETEPEAERLRVQRLVLRYINAIECDYTVDNVLEFLGKNMKTTVAVPHALFEGTGVSAEALSFDQRISFACTEPRGSVGLRFARGTRGGTDALIWETIVHSTGEDAPGTEKGIITWAESAHNLAGDWFFKIINGELSRRFE